MERSYNVPGTLQSCAGYVEVITHNGGARGATCLELSLCRGTVIIETHPFYAAEATRLHEVLA
jgi:hypothetical protein